jgi:hypothetical protein
VHEVDHQVHGHPHTERGLHRGGKVLHQVQRGECGEHRQHAVTDDSSHVGAEPPIEASSCLSHSPAR